MNLVSQADHLQDEIVPLVILARFFNLPETI